ncbi:MAG: GGDEF domain-containing protein [Candidatus Binatia bacterium]
MKKDTRTPQKHDTLTDSSAPQLQGSEPSQEMEGPPNAVSPSSPTVSLPGSTTPRFHQFFQQLSVFQGTLVGSASLVLLSVAVTYLVCGVTSPTQHVPLWYLVVAGVVASIVAPVPSYLVARLLHDIESAWNDAHRLAITDELTNAINRRHFMALAEREFARAQRQNHPLSLILFDIDHFKMINDSYGHACGDAVLRNTSAVCLGTLRGHDIFARYGDEEFALLLPDTDATHANTVAERLRQNIQNQAFLSEGKTLSLTISLGVTTRGTDTSTLNTFLCQAEKALFAAKHSGRNCVKAA